jgi:hypothetical protein
MFEANFIAAAASEDSNMGGIGDFLKASCRFHSAPTRSMRQGRQSRSDWRCGAILSSRSIFRAAQAAVPTVNANVEGNNADAVVREVRREAIESVRDRRADRAARLIVGPKW